MRAARIALLLAVGLVPAATAHADETIGSSLSTPANGPFLCTDPGGCTLATRIPAGTLTATAAGVVTRWRVSVGASTGAMRLRVIRRDVGTAAAVGGSAVVTPVAGRVNVFPTRIPIAAGDGIGLDCCTPTAEVLRATPGAELDLWQPALGATQTAPFTPLVGEVVINADVEPDGDADGYGDETQDNCPVAANPTQADLDHDGQGDACDLDDDGDGFLDGADRCPAIAGPEVGCPAVTPPPNRAPTVRFRAPLAGTAIGPSFRIVLDVADDRGSPTVSVFDDDGTICVLRRAPYACTWTPTGADVGRATLLASAVDSAGLSTLGIVRVRVKRFTASLTQRQRHRKGVTRVTGRLVLPAGVTRAQGCSGTVRVRLRKARRTATLTRRCTYSARLPFRPGRARVSFSGNSVLAPT